MKYFKLLAVMGLLAGFVLVPNKVSAVPQQFLQGGNSFGQNATLGTNDTFSLIFETGNLEAMRIDTNGNVGVGTALPQGHLHVFGGELIFESIDDLVVKTPSGFQQPGNIQFRDENNGLLGQLSFEASEQIFNLSATGGFDLAIQRDTGFVGVGTFGPQGKLHVWKPSQTTLIVGGLETTDSLPNQISRGCLIIGDSDGDGVTYVTANDGVLSSSTTKPPICD